MSEPANGNNTVVLLAREPAWGTEGVVKPVQILVVPGGGMLGDTTLIPSELFGGDPNPRDAITGRQAANGDLVTVPNTTSIAYLMEFALGTRVYDAGPLTHTSKLTSGTLPSLSIDESQDLSAGVEYKRSLGVRFDKTSFSFNADGFQKVSFTALGKSTSIDVATAPLGDPTSPLDWTTQPIFEDLQLAAADVLVDGTPCAEIVSGSLDVNHNHFSTHYVAGGGGVRRSLPRRRATVGGTIKTFFEDMTLYNFAKNGTYVALSMKWIVDASNYFQLVVPRVRLKRADPKIADGPQEIDFSFAASKDSVSGTSVYTVTKNARNDAYYTG